MSSYSPKRGVERIKTTRNEWRCQTTVSEVTRVLRWGESVTGVWDRRVNLSVDNVCTPGVCFGKLKSSSAPATLIGYEEWPSMRLGGRKCAHLGLSGIAG